MTKELQEEIISSEKIYTGKVISLRRDTVRLSNGKTAAREVVEHPGATAVVALTEAGEVLLVEQYRRPADEVLLEIPAGKLEPGEAPLACARRELAEETGFGAAEWEKLGEFYTAPGFADERIHLFLARKLTPAVERPDEDELINLRRIPLARAREMARSGQFADAKTIVGVCLCPEA
jgi:ADP-ribose pyrophosphatase